MGAVENEVARKNNTLQKWVQARYVPIQRVVYKSKGPESRDTMPALDPTGKLDLSFLSTGSGSGLDADLLDGVHAAGFLPIGGGTLTGPLDYVNALMEYAYFSLKASGTGGWDRSYGFHKSTDAARLGQFGGYGSAANTLSCLYTGTAYTATWQEWTAALSTFNTPVALQTGSPSAVSLGFASDPNTGLYSTGADSLALAYGGSVGLNFTKSASDNYLRPGNGRTADGYAYIDLIGDTTYTTAGLRIIRGNTGADATSAIQHRGTGTFSITATEAAAIALGTTNAARVTISAAGLVGIGVTPATQQLKVLGSVAVGGDQGGTASYTTFTNATAAVSTGTVTVKSRTASNVNTTGFLKVFVGTAAKYVPYVD